MAGETIQFSMIAPAVLTLLGVIVGAFSTLSISKRQFRASVHSKFRQDWINTLRDLIAEHQSLLMTIALYELDKKSHGLEGRISTVQKITTVGSKIQLMLNMNENDHTVLSQLLERSVGIARNVDLKNSDFDNLKQEITSVSQKILKREWERVKKGE